MNERIKKVLNDLKKCANDNKSHLLIDYEIKHILCYITNLQEENQKLKIENATLKAERDTYKSKCDNLTNVAKVMLTGKNYNDLVKENQKLNKIIDELEKWLDDYYKSNRKWYNYELTNHDRQYFEREYRTTEFMIVKFLNELTELKNEVE